MQHTHVPGMLREAVRRHGPRTAQVIDRDGERHTTSYEELGRAVQRLAWALVAAGVEPGDRVATCARNIPEWTVTDLAVLSAGAVTVSVYTTSTSTQVRQVLVDSGARLLFVGGQAELATVLPVWHECPSLETVVVLDGSRGPGGPRCITEADLLERCPTEGQDGALEARSTGLHRDSLATLIYTPGTTGEPKGVMLTHGNVLSQIEAIAERFELQAGDRSMCFLPLAHAYERFWSFMVLHFGMENHYVPDPHRVGAVLRRDRPDAFVSTPRLYHKIQEAVEERAGALPGGRRTYEWAVSVGVAMHRARSQTGTVPLWLRSRWAAADRLVLHHVRDAVGGPKRLLSCGGSALRPSASELFLAAGVPIYHGYGQIETSAMTTCNVPADITFDTVGQPVLGCQVRVAANGEILVRGSNVMAGYYNRPAETAAAMDGGWFHTGDMGHFTRSGNLVVTDRLIDLIVTAHGTVVAPQPLESALMAHPFVARAVVLGEDRQYLAALIQPEFRALEDHAQRQGWRAGSRAELLAHPRIQGIFGRLVDDVGADLDQHVRLRAFRLLDEELTETRGDLTPTQGVRRAMVEFRYAHLIGEMYGTGI